jgi:hypothetical protein
LLALGNEQVAWLQLNKGQGIPDFLK